MMADFFGR